MSELVPLHPDQLAAARQGAGLTTTNEPPRLPQSDGAQSQDQRRMPLGVHLVGAAAGYLPGGEWVRGGFDPQDGRYLGEGDDTPTLIEEVAVVPGSAAVQPHPNNRHLREHVVRVANGGIAVAKGAGNRFVDRFKVAATGVREELRELSAEVGKNIRQMKPAPVNSDDATVADTRPYTSASSLPADPAAIRYTPAPGAQHGATTHYAPEGASEDLDDARFATPDSAVTVHRFPSQGEIQAQMPGPPLGGVESTTRIPTQQERERAVDSLFAAIGDYNIFHAEIKRLYGIQDNAGNGSSEYEDNIRYPLDIMRQIIQDFNGQDRGRGYLERLHSFIEGIRTRDPSQSIEEALAVAPLMMLAPSEGGFQQYCRLRYAIALDETARSNLATIRQTIMNCEGRDGLLGALKSLDNFLKGLSSSPQA